VRIELHVLLVFAVELLFRDLRLERCFRKQYGKIREQLGAVFLGDICLLISVYDFIASKY